MLNEQARLGRACKTEGNFHRPPRQAGVESLIQSDRRCCHRSLRLVRQVGAIEDIGRLKAQLNAGFVVFQRVAILMESEIREVIPWIRCQRNLAEQNNTFDRASEL